MEARLKAFSQHRIHKKGSIRRWRRLKHLTIVSTWHIWKWITEIQVHFSLAHPAVIQD